MTLVIGLTGNIATGKSSVLQAARRLGVAVFDADQQVRGLMSSSGIAVDAIRRAFPLAAQSGEIDRTILAKIVFDSPEALAQLEAIIHPHIRQQEERFITTQTKQKRAIIMLEIPLLYETGAQRLCDKILVTHCPAFLQWQRARKRKGMSRSKFEKILDRQWPQEVKMALADGVINTGNGKRHSLGQLYHYLQKWQGSTQK